ncbi:hypothetical protein DY000_02025199 [Brassica cretica]|uniref:Uncharacterized protein n=1 Tax=Brassica cretica TaxID=69181 RepID=A0ABQ7EEK1_BRACR|nr:hypothetical protein DY000_02025199 [Brassica cretica]
MNRGSDALQAGEHSKLRSDPDPANQILDLQLKRSFLRKIDHTPPRQHSGGDEHTPSA